MLIDKKHLCELINQSNTIQLVIARDSIVEDTATDVFTAPFNDYILKQNGTLELWYNIGYEI